MAEKRKPDGNTSYQEIHLSDWRQAYELMENLADVGGEWIFRGMRDASWKLQTTLERVAMSYRKGTLKGLADVERRTLQRFRRMAKMHGVTIAEDPIDATEVPAGWWTKHPGRRDASLIEWLALLQHYGGATRLLDFTKSFWIAAFFAVEPSASGRLGERQAIWAIRSRTLWHRAMGCLGLQKPRRYQVAFRRRAISRIACRQTIVVDDKWHKKKPPGLEQPLALPVEPETLNSRVAAQRGCFVFPLVAEESFERNLFSTFDLQPDIQTQTQPISYDKKNRLGESTLIAKILLPAATQEAKLRDMLRKQHKALQEMNITGASLFPDLSGAARSTLASIWD